MGSMIDGVYYRDGETAPTNSSGEWAREPSVVRHWITKSGEAGPTGEADFTAEKNRYHLYVAWNCPWAHRALLARLFKGLEEAISISVALPRRNEDGWIFDVAGEFSDPLLGVSAVHEVYSRGVENYTGRITVPVLLDKRPVGSSAMNQPISSACSILRLWTVVPTRQTSVRLPLSTRSMN